MSNNDFSIEKKVNVQQNVDNANNGSHRVIDESAYAIRAPKENGPAVIGRGGDPLFRNIVATTEQLQELNDGVASVQKFVEIEKSNEVAHSTLQTLGVDGDVRFTKAFSYDGVDYDPISIKGFKNPMGIEIPRLQILGKDQITNLSGFFALQELTKRADAFKAKIASEQNVAENYEQLPQESADEVPIEDYQGTVS